MECNPVDDPMQWPGDVFDERAAWAASYFNVRFKRSKQDIAKTRVLLAGEANKQQQYLKSIGIVPFFL